MTNQTKYFLPDKKMTSIKFKISPCVLSLCWLNHPFRNQCRILKSDNFFISVILFQQILSGRWFALEWILLEICQQTFYAVIYYIRCIRSEQMRNWNLSRREDKSYISLSYRFKGRRNLKKIFTQLEWKLLWIVLIPH